MSWLTDYLTTSTLVAGGGETRETRFLTVEPDLAVSTTLNEPDREQLRGTDLCVLGGPIANPVSRAVLYHVDNGVTAAAAMNRTDRKWVFDLVPDQAVADTNITDLHHEDVHPRWPLLNRETRERFLPDSLDETRRDFFLITYTANPYNKNRDVVLAAGCSQPGTAAAYNILQNTDGMRGGAAFHRYLVKASNQGDTYFTAVGRCHVEDSEPVKVADIDFVTH